MIDTETGESKDGKGSADHDAVFEFGHWRACLTTLQQARLLVMRGYVKDGTGAIDGDSDYISTPTGLLVPSKPYIGRYWHDDPEAP